MSRGCEMSSSNIPLGHAYAKESGADRRLSVRTWYIIGTALACTAPFLLGDYGLNLVIQIGYFAIAALGLNLLVGCTGQISIGHAGFFGFGAFCSAWLSHRCGVPVLLAMPLSALATSLLGLLVGVPAARIGGLYLA